MESWEEVLKKLTEAYELSVGTADEKRIAEDIRRFKQWVQDGSLGKCPIDLSRYGLGEESFPREEGVVPPEEPPVSLSVGESAAPPTIEFFEETGETEEIVAESIAEEEIRRQGEPFHKALEQVQKQMEEGKWVEAWNLARTVEQQAPEGEWRERAAQFARKIRAELDERIGDLHKQAQDALEQGKLDLAMQQYRQILVLDPEDRRARQGIHEIEQRQGQKFDWSKLRAGLKERRNIQRLGEAVYEAEALDAEERLPEELRSLLIEARSHYDQMRQRMGEETTMMRFGDLNARAQAIEKIRERIVRGEKFILDATTGRERPADQVLEEARNLLKKASAEIAQHELNIAEKHLRTNPKYVRQRLQKALQLPFEDEQKRELEKKLVEAEEWSRKEEQAYEWQQQAFAEEDLNRKLGLLLQAYKVFPALVGLKEQLDQIRQVTLATVRVQVQQLSSQAEMLLEVEEFESARGKIEEIRQRIALWPEEPAPQEIQDLLQQVNALQDQLNQRERDWKEYQERANSIRQWVKDPHNRERALRTFQEMKSDPRFNTFRDFSVLEDEVEQYKSVQEQLTDAQRAREANNWGRVYEISQRLLSSGQAGELASQVQELHEEAVLELNIARLHDLLADNEIYEANNILTLMLRREAERSPEREANLRQRLSSEINHIHQAIRATSSIQPLYDEALRLIGLAGHLAFQVYLRPYFGLRRAREQNEQDDAEIRAWLTELGIELDDPEAASKLRKGLRPQLLSLLQQQAIQKRWEALKRLRYVGGEGIKAQEEWPPYVLSLRTAEARQAARLVEESLYISLVEPIRERYAQSRQTGRQLDEEECRQLAEWASIAYQLGLSKTEEERLALQWTELEWGKRRADREERTMNWQEAINIWRELLQRYPDSSEIRARMRNARIQHVVWTAHALAYNHHKVEEAIQLIQELQNESEMENAWVLNLALAEKYSLLGNFESAFANLERAERIARFWPEAGEQERAQREAQHMREKVESMRRMREALEKCQHSISAEEYGETLRILQNALQDTRIKEEDKQKLDRELERVFEEGKRKLLEKVHEQEREQSDASKVAVVTLLLSLQRMEIQMGIPEDQQEAFRRLQQLRTRLKPAADAAIKEARDFQPKFLSLEHAIQRADELTARLQSFESLSDLFASELGPLRDPLKRLLAELVEIHKRLNDFKKLLEEGNQPQRWDEALQTGNFDWLERQYQAMLNLGMPFNEISTFGTHLKEVREIYGILNEAITRIRKMFQEESFEGVQQEILLFSNLPLTRPNGEAWQTIRAEEYHSIWQALGARLRIVDASSGQEIVGWEEVKRQAIERANEVEEYRKWNEEFNYLLGRLQQSLDNAKASSDAPYRVYLKTLDEVKSLAQQTLDALAAPPSKLARSRTVRNILRRGQQSQDEVKQVLRWVEDEIQRTQGLLEREPFPSPEELSAAASQKDWIRLERLLEHAERAGILTPDEKRRIEIYRQVLNEAKSSRKKKIGFF